MLLWGTYTNLKSKQISMTTAYACRSGFLILATSTQIRLHLAFSDWFGKKIEFRLVRINLLILNDFEPNVIPFGFQGTPESLSGNRRKFLANKYSLRKTFPLIRISASRQQTRNNYLIVKF